MEPTPRSRYGFACQVGELGSNHEEVLGALSSHAGSRNSWGSIQHLEVSAWRESLGWLSAALVDVPATWLLVLEYEIPRRGGRIDAVLLADDLVFVLEFKATRADLAAQRQAEDYGLELLDFHQASHHLPIFPIVCSGDAPYEVGHLADRWGVGAGSKTPPSRLGELISGIYEEHHDGERDPIDASAWLNAAYEPTPTIIEAASALYAGHSVRELAVSEASAESLERTEEAVIRVVRGAQDSGRNAICFVTGVPGAGKTLAGMNAVHSREDGAVFLSGNGPLVAVLQEVLAQNLVLRDGGRITEARRRSKTLVTNVHNWIREYESPDDGKVPHEAVIVFDEAQRAWSRERSKAKFDRDASEPEVVLRAMARRPGSAVVCLVGGGQEINTGEAGLSEWGRAITEQPNPWDVVLAPGMEEGSLAAGSSLFPEGTELGRASLRVDEALHLGVPRRSFRSQHLSRWVEHVLANEPNEATIEYEHLSQYPIVMTRDLARARQWIRGRSRGLRRCGLLASSGAKRLRPHGISVTEHAKAVDWFLKPEEDVRSSNFLEVAGSEFDVQGLELDWSCLAWGGDLTRRAGSWELQNFQGTSWKAVRNSDARRYVLNRYRVLLTRAREGMIIWVPPGDPSDVTRLPERYESVYEYLSRCGVKTIGD